MRFSQSLFAAALVAPLSALATESNFSVDNEGWIIIDHTSSTDPLPAAQIRATAENPLVSGGRLQIQDIGNSWNWIVAPGKFHQSWAGFTDLKIDLITDDAPTVFNLRFFIADGVNSAWYEFPLAGTPGSSVLNLSAPLQESAWNVTGQWEHLIANVNAFYVRLDLNNNVISEMTTVDSVVLVDGSEPPAPTFPVEFPSETGSEYQVESSSDLEDWKNVGEPVPGNGSKITINVPLTDAPRLFFRVRKLGSP